jgi:hypothetical protein
MFSLQNCANKVITIPRFSNIGYIENANNPCFDSISGIKSKVCEIKVSHNPQLPEPEPQCQEDRAEFLAQAKLMSLFSKNTSKMTCCVSTMM